MGQAFPGCAGKTAALRIVPHLLDVACTRARDCLLVAGVQHGSEFLADLRPG